MAKTVFCTIELKKVYRQNDTRFLDLLNAIRENRCMEAELAALNSRYVPEHDRINDREYIRLTTHNYQAHQIDKPAEDG